MHRYTFIYQYEHVLYNQCLHYICAFVCVPLCVCVFFLYFYYLFSATFSKDKQHFSERRRLTAKGSFAAKVDRSNTEQSIAGLVRSPPDVGSQVSGLWSQVSALQSRFSGLQSPISSLVEFFAFAAQTFLFVYTSSTSVCICMCVSVSVYASVCVWCVYAQSVRAHIKTKTQ